MTTALCLTIRTQFAIKCLWHLSQQEWAIWGQNSGFSVAWVNHSKTGPPDICAIFTEL